MKVNSTGLGKTTLTAHISGIGPGEEPGGLTMKIESTEPVHWYITCRLEPRDIRAAMRMVMRPRALARILRMALGLTGRPLELAAAVEAQVEAKVEAKQNG